MRRIVSRDNPHYKALKKLLQSGRERRRTGLAVLDGMHLIDAYGRHCGSPIEILVSDSGTCRQEIVSFLESSLVGAAITVLGDALFAELAVVETPSGIMAVVDRPRPPEGRGPDMLADTVVLDGIQDPGNVGSILRSAAAAGFRQVLLSADCAQAWAPKTLRAAMGAHFQLDVLEHGDLPAFLSAYRGQPVATLLDAPTSLYSADLAGPVAWVFGSEGLGVRPSVAAMTRVQVRIPMPGPSESLNVAAAAAICLFETVRRRQTQSSPSPAAGV